MISIRVDSLTFDFNDDWAATQYDKWSFYRNRMSRVDAGIKAVDLLAISPTHDLYLIEAKDYRLHRRMKPSRIDQEVAQKVLHTLAAILPASVAQGCDEERDFARRALSCRRLLVVLHLEQHKKGTVRAPVIALQNVQLGLRRRLQKVVGSRPLVSTIAGMQNLGWSCH
jgi:hypothetical protein